MSVKGYRIAPGKMRLDVVLEVDMENSTTLYSEFVCGPDKDENEELICRYVTRRGKGNSRPKILRFQTIKKDRSKTIKRKKQFR